MKVAYHYCSITTLESILSSKTIWLCNLTKSNDEEEVVRCFSNLWNEVKERLRQADISPDVLEIQIKNLDTAMEIQKWTDQPYGCCFCEKKDLVHQWKEYGDEGKGVSVGFDLEWFPIVHDLPATSTNMSNAIAWHDVIYESNSFKDEMFRFCCEAIKKHGNKAWILSILPTFKHYSGFYKNPTFEGEREVRIAFYPEDRQERASIGLSDLSELERPHYELSWVNNDSMALKSITIGYDCKYSEVEIRKLLNDSGVTDNIEIDKSICSYRTRRM